MFRRPFPVRALVLSSALVLAAGCASHPPPDFDHFAWRLDLPVDTTAAIVAGAVQRATGCDRPNGPEGAIAEPLGDDGYRITYHQSAIGWQPAGSVRLRVPGHGTRTIAVPAGPGEPAAAAAPARIDLRVLRDGASTMVAGRLPTALRRPVNDALRLALDPDAALPGLDEPNLASHVAALLRRRADAALAAGDDDAAATLRRRAAALGDAAPELLLQVGDHAAACGDAARARASYWQALARCHDAAERATLGARLAALDEHRDAEASRRSAAARLSAGDPTRAAGLLHCAQRDGRDPSRDYAFLGELHRRAHDPTGARASDLLAREHAAVPALPDPTVSPGHPWQVEATAPAFASPIR
ncbi:MAG: hypothetical protein U1F60_04250 [Planctomycetota bacterium]